MTDLYPGTRIEFLDDLRQGVTPTQHEVLDLIDQRGADQIGNIPFIWNLMAAEHYTKLAVRTIDPKAARQLAIQAASQLIEAAEKIGRQIESKGDGA